MLLVKDNFYNFSKIFLRKFVGPYVSVSEFITIFIVCKNNSCNCSLRLFICIKFVVKPNAIIRQYYHMLKNKGKYFKKLIRDFREVKNRPQDLISLKSRLCMIIS